MHSVWMSLFLTLFVAPMGQAQVTKTSYEQVWKAVEVDPDVETLSKKEQEILSSYQGNSYPTYLVTAERFFKKTKSGFVDLLQKAAQRTLESHVDVYPSFDKLLHSNGICFQGHWVIRESSQWTGLFQKGTRAPVVVRASTTLGGVLKSEKRGFSLAIKFFPGAHKKDITKTVNLFLIDTLAGKKMDSIFESIVTNQPDFGLSFDFPLGAHVVKTFAFADLDPAYRPVGHAADVEVGGRIVNQPSGPTGLALAPVSRFQGPSPDDFRQELLDFGKKRKIVYQVYASDLRPKRASKNDWTLLGELILQNPTISYGCDRRLHFPHPKVDGRLNAPQ